MHLICQSCHMHHHVILLHLIIIMTCGQYKS